MIRRATLMDGKALSDLMRRIDRETKYMLYEPEERSMSTEQAEAFIERFGQAANSDIFVVDIDEQLVGEPGAQFFQAIADSGLADTQGLGHPGDAVLLVYGDEYHEVLHVELS